ncbi:MAG: hypothetical protein Q8O14_06440 [bacterium]|jgi:hypothetical protein|nr:hypothetical protein [bacterium]
MRVFLTASILLAAFGTAQAGSYPYENRDYYLQPGDFGKPVIVAPLPGLPNDPWRIDDPDIIIDDDGPSEEDAGLVYSNPARYQMPRRAVWKPDR